MQQLIEDLLAYSRTNITESKLEKKDLNIIIKEVKDDLKDLILEKRASFEISGICEMNIITFQFRQLMFNLISNALKFAKPDQPLQIFIKCSIENGKNLNEEKLIPEKAYYHISVEDTGIGFVAQYKTRIFEVFQKLHSKEEYAGTGIGLAIVKKIVENHGGIITATGTLNKGARFDLYIPV
jgi:signal transduction histidine kinase